MATNVAQLTGSPLNNQRVRQTLEGPTSTESSANEAEVEAHSNSTTDTTSNTTADTIADTTADITADAGTDGVPGSTSITVTAADHAETAEQPDNHDAGTNGSELRIGKFGYIADVLGLVFALCFLALGICIGTLHKQQVSGFGEKVWEASQTAASLWPLLFAFTMGAAAKSVARLLAEKGARLIEIEYLMASQTVISSFVSPFLLRYYGIPVAILLLLWPFSPVGSQAILRIIGAKDNTVFMADASPPIPYIKPSLFVEMNFTNRGEAGLQDVIASLLGSSLYSPEAGLQNMNGTLADFDDRAARLRTQFSRFGADMWGNVRIPKLESLPGYDPSHPENWVDVQYRSQLINYASLVGVRAERFPENITGNVSWTMGASYHQFSCQPWHVVGMGTDGIKSLRNHSFLEENYKNMFIFHNPALNNSNWTTVLDDMFQGRNIAVVIDTDKGGWDTSWKSSASREPREPEDWPWDDGSYSFPPRSVYFGFRGMSNETAFTKCEPSVSYVVVNVTSEMTNEGTTPLVVNRIKRMDNFPTSPTLHVWQHPYITWMISDCFPKLLRYYEEGYVRGVVRPPPHVRYILDPAHFREDPWIYKNTEFPEWVAANFTNGMFQDRFGLVFNTFWRAMSHDISNFDLEWMANGHPKYVATTQASYLSPAPQTYVLNMAWLAVYFVANVIVLVAAVVALYMRSICRAPDILGNVSSILRYSRHFDDSALKSAIDGTAAARVKHLGKVRVRIGDVENFALVGKIEFARDETAMAIDVRRQYK